MTLAALRIGGPAASPIASIGLAFVIMVFTDVMPKTLGARALGAARPAGRHRLLLSAEGDAACRLARYGDFQRPAPDFRRARAISRHQQNLTLDELRTIVTDAGALLPRRRQRMLMSILELEDMTVDEIMIPDNELVGIDLDDEWQAIVDTNSAVSPTAGCRFSAAHIENLVGLLHVRSLVVRRAGTP